MADAKNDKPLGFEDVQLPWFDQSPESGADDGEKRAEGEGKVDPKLADLEKQVAVLTEKLTSAENDRLALMAKPSGGGEQDNGYKPLPTTLQTDDLPDPTVEPEKYVTELNKRVATVATNAATNVASQNKQANDEQSLYTQVWNEFGSKHAKYAENADLAEYAAGRVLRAAKANGYDVAKYITVAKDRFFEEVVDTMNHLNPGLKGDDPDGGDKPDKKAEEDNRTAGIFGGEASGGKPDDTEQGFRDNNDMFADVREFQEKFGFHA